MVVNKIDRTKNDMVMDMPFVYVGSLKCYNKVVTEVANKI